MKWFLLLEKMTKLYKNVGYNAIVATNYLEIMPETIRKLHISSFIRGIIKLLEVLDI